MYLRIHFTHQSWESQKADYETAFIMYQWMVIENYDDFRDLFREVSLEVIDEIDRLWIDYSKGKFGIKGQAKIYLDLARMSGEKSREKRREEWDRMWDESFERESEWDRFGDLVGWKQGKRWFNLGNMEVAYRTPETHDYHLPKLMYIRVGLWWVSKVEEEDGWGWGYMWDGWWWEGLVSLLPRRDLKDCSI
ncbi:GUN4-like protein (fragment) [Microcystis aeruginosa PCC 7941]|jgi:hypothetical protein